MLSILSLSAHRYQKISVKIPPRLNDVVTGLESKCNYGGGDSSGVDGGVCGDGGDDGGCGGGGMWKGWEMVLNGRK